MISVSYGCTTPDVNTLIEAAARFGGDIGKIRSVFRKREFSFPPGQHPTALICLHVCNMEKCPYLLTYSRTHQQQQSVILPPVIAMLII